VAHAIDAAENSMSITGQVQEPSLRGQLLADYEIHEDRIEQAAVTELWQLADWLAEYVPPRHPGPRGASELDIAISLEDLTERRGRSLRWLQNLRRLALATEADRLPQITPSVYAEALRAHSWDLMAANQAIVTRGHRLRDQREGKVESLDAIRDSLDRRPPEDRAELVRELAADPTVAELLGDEPLPDFGAASAGRRVAHYGVRVSCAHADDSPRLRADPRCSQPIFCEVYGIAGTRRPLGLSTAS
jgi:hypothetical protein